MKTEIEKTKERLYNIKDKAIIRTIETGIKVLNYVTTNPDSLDTINNLYSNSLKILSLPLKLNMYHKVKTKIDAFSAYKEK